jgi:flagellar basal-body rod protein FlgF
MPSTNSIYMMTAKMAGQQEQLRAVANNVANVNSSGYKRQEVDFHTEVKRYQGQDTGQFAMNQPTRVAYEVGSLQRTGNSLDMGLANEGFFAIDVNGQTVYTRNGQFTLSGEGTIITPDGNPLLDANNAPIALPANAKTINITQNGLVTTEQGAAGAVGVFDFTPDQLTQLRPAGNTGFIAPAGVAPAQAIDPVVVQGAVEQANVSTITEMTKLTELNRAYQSAQKLISRMEDLQERTIRQLPSLQ